MAAAVTAEETRKGVEELGSEKNTESAIDSSEFQSPEIVDDIKCDKSEKEISSSELVNIDVSIYILSFNFHCGIDKGISQFRCAFR